MSMPPEVEEVIQKWMEWDRNGTTRREIADLQQSRNVNELQKRFSARIEFGTAGLRGRMCAGISSMNDVTVIQTSQGLCSYLIEVDSSVHQSGIVIGYDSRHNSERWAHLVAAAFLRKNIPVHLFSVFAPTPYVAFAVKHMKASCGVVITASHNPKEDNGYKVYWSNAAQIIPPHDKNISEHILHNLEMDDVSWDVSPVANHRLRTDPLSEIDKAYLAEVSSLVVEKERNASSDLKMVYTAMHGVGWRCVQMVLDTFGFKSCISVVEQNDPDPEFQTVTFPNPEEGKSALNLAIKTAETHGAQLILANDPDADRLAVAEKRADSGSWKVFTGNEIGALFGWWCWTQYKHRNPDATGENVWMMASTVSSKILQSIAETEGFNFHETLTGFKWMGNKARELEADNQTVLFAFEEAIGFMVGTVNYDKDGLSALGVIYELAAHLHSNSETLQQQLDKIYTRYGHHISDNSYYICHDKDKIKKIFHRIRHYADSPDTYPSTIGGASVRFVRDLTTGFDSQREDQKATLPVSKSSEMVTFTLANGMVLTLRTSGTEPKIKYYSEIRQKGVSRESLEKELKDTVKQGVEELLQPTANDLIPRSG